MEAKGQKPRKREPVTPERVAQIKDWKKKNVQYLNIEINKDRGLIDRINAAIAAGAATSKQGFAIAAMEEKLDELGL